MWRNKWRKIRSFSLLILLSEKGFFREINWKIFSFILSSLFTYSNASFYNLNKVNQTRRKYRQTRFFCHFDEYITTLNKYSGSKSLPICTSLFLLIYISFSRIRYRDLWWEKDALIFSTALFSQIVGNRWINKSWLSITAIANYSGFRPTDRLWKHKLKLWIKYIFEFLVKYILFLFIHSRSFHN